VDSYPDDAVGEMEEDADGHLVITRVRLAPHTEFSGTEHPATEVIHEMHHEAHEQCYLANSVKTAVEAEPSWEIGVETAVRSHHRTG